MADLSLRGICKIYPGDVTAVRDFNLEIEDKEFIIFVGPSGCGKSTTLRMVAGLEEVSKGELYIDGRLVNDVVPKDRDIAMVFQNYALYPHMTVAENMSFGLELKKTPKAVIKEKVEHAAKILDITHLLDRKPAALSGGQRQRVALGRAIVREPKVFLLDEPLSNLDAKLRAQMRTELLKLHKRLGTTFIYVTHDQTEAMTMGTRIVVMKDGIVQQVDTPQEVYDHPYNMFVAGFIGSPQMNFIEADLIEKEGRVFVCFAEDEIVLPEQQASLIREKGYVGKAVVAGIRPENIDNSEYFIRKHPDSVLSAAVEVTELMGAETYLYLSKAGISLTARVSGKSRVYPGDNISIAIDTETIHIFDKDSSLTVL